MAIAALSLYLLSDLFNVRGAVIHDIGPFAAYRPSLLASSAI